MAFNPYAALESAEPGRIGWRVHYFSEVGTTQEIAAELAASGAAHGTVVVAERQTAGRGRMGRQWHSPAGVNFYGTILLRPKIPIGEIARLSLTAGVAVAEALETVAPGLVALKWPNDVWLKGRKTGGIIAEAVTDSQQTLQCVLLGIGLNLNLVADQIPTELRERAISVRIATGRACDRVAVAAALFDRLDRCCRELEAQGFSALRERWTRYSALTGRRVTVVDTNARHTGMVRGIDEDGALVLDSGGVLVKILAGDVTVEGAYV